MIYYLLLTYFAIRSTQLLFKGRLVTVLGINLNDPSFDSGSESAEHIPTLNSTKDALEIGSDGAGNVGAQLTSSVRGLSGVTMTDKWQLSTTFSGGATPISSNLVQVDDAEVGLVGPSMNESSGVFTFPSTGNYYIVFVRTMFNDSSDDRGTNITIDVTSDNGSTWVTRSQTHGHIVNIGSNRTYGSMVTSYNFKVSDTSNDKVRFTVTAASDTATYGDSSNCRTHITFIRDGDL